MSVCVWTNMVALNSAARKVPVKFCKSNCMTINMAVFRFQHSILSQSVIKRKWEIKKAPSCWADEGKFTSFLLFCAMNKKEGMEWIMEEEWSIWIFVILLNPFSVNLRIFRLRPNVPAASFTQAGASPPPEILSRTQTLTLHHRSRGKYPESQKPVAMEGLEFFLSIKPWLCVGRGRQ